jgi:4-hydroxy-tetrahydrodipicolinate synthase
LQQRLTSIRAAIQKFPMVAANKAILARRQGTPAWNTVRPPLVALPDDLKAQLFASLDTLGFGLHSETAAAT